MLRFFERNFCKNPFGGSGQTLIETIVAIAILTTGIIGGLALAIQSLSSSERVTEEIIAINLAREGAEFVRNVRDTNWLQNGFNDCDYIENGQECIPEWADFGGPFCNCSFLFQCALLDYNLTAGNSSPFSCRNYYLGWFPDGVPGNMIMYNAGGSFNPGGFNRLNLYNGAYIKGGILFGVEAPGALTDFYRRIRIFRDENAPFSGENFRLRVESIVWWQGRGCQDVNSAEINTNCKVVVEEYLTNWKNY